VTAFDPLPSFSLLHLVEPFRLHGESAFETLDRLALGEAILAAKWKQVDAATRLGTSEWIVRRKLAAFGVVKKEKRSAA